MQNSEYWKIRFGQLEAAQNRKGAEVYAEIERQYRQAQKEIEGKIDAWYRRFADNNNVSMAEARRMLGARELAELKWDVNDYIRHGKENAVDQKWMKELENASARFHISRLEALKLQTQQSLEIMFGNQLDGVDTAMKHIFLDGYYHTAYEIQKGFGIGWDIAGLDQRQIEKIIMKPWAVDGKNFSERIWGNKEKLISEVHSELTRNILLGQDPQKAIDAIAKKMNTSKVNAGRLVMTEEAYFSSAAQGDCFNDLDVEKYEIVATLDSHTSEICQGLDGQVFSMKDFEPGVTAPPFHVNCRSTTVPYFEDNFGQPGERAARGEDGKTYYVPADMTYQEWKESFVDGNDKSGLQSAQSDDTIRINKKTGTVAETQTFKEMQQYMQQNYNIEVLDSVSELDFQSVKEGVSGIEYIIQEFPQAKDSFKTIGTEYYDLMCSGYNGDISFNPKYYETREGALLAHGIGEGIIPGGTHPKGNNCFGTGCHEAGHILEKALADKANGGECVLSEMNWQDSVYAKEVVSNACEEAKKLPECRGMTNKQMKDSISAYAGCDSDYSFAETMSEAVCDFALNGEKVSLEIWKILKKELG